MVTRQPWGDDPPIHVRSGAGAVERFLTRWTTTTTTRTLTPASDAVTTGFLRTRSPGPEILGKAARIGALGQRVNRGRQLIASDIDVLFDGFGIPVRHVSVLQLSLVH